MGFLACHGGLCRCQFGSAPAPLKVLPQGIFTATLPIATIQDHIPFLNVGPFGLCKSPKHPVFAAKHVPVPCTPLTLSPWVGGGAPILLKGIPALSQSHILPCLFGGTITVSFPGQTKVSTL